jgi:hypothetical protein
LIVDGFSEPIAESDGNDVGSLDRGQVSTVIDKNETGSRHPLCHRSAMRDWAELIVSTP